MTDPITCYMIEAPDGKLMLASAASTPDLAFFEVEQVNRGMTRREIEARGAKAVAVEIHRIPTNLNADLATMAMISVATKDRCNQLEAAINSAIDMINNCPDAPRAPSSLPMMILDLLRKVS